jgi:GT2 family glycosyltransferase
LDREGPVTSFLGGASALSGPMFRQVGGYEAAFFYAHEESDLAWRAIGQGWSFVYAPSLVVTHPMLPTTRHPGAIERSMRNRVWLVRRNLPLPVALVHLVVWVAIGLTRSRSAAGAASLLRGLRTGLGPCPRPPVPVGTSQRWRTTWRLTRAGRPPIL